jgi:hypothetical protein
MSGRCLTPPPFVKRRTITLDQATIVKDVTEEPGSGVRIIRRPSASSSPAARPTAPIPPPPKQPEPPPKQTAASVAPIPPVVSQTISSKTSKGDSPTVLVINASQHMAHEITHQLSVTLPGSTILFAPTLNLALWILKRRNIDLILTSSLLPDGPLPRLHEFLEQMSPPPELVVLSDISASRSELESHPGYRFVELRRLSAQTREMFTEEEPDITQTISNLGADIRNDLNNPLQEIVALAFVAHSSQGLSPSAEQALSAIQAAASNMATVVNKLEDKIRGAVRGNAA